MSLETKIKAKQFIVDEEQNQLTFTDLRFYRNEAGEYFPSVTTIIDAFPKPTAFYTWLKDKGQDADEIRDAAGLRGSNSHSLIERYNNGEQVNLMDINGHIAWSTVEWGNLEKWVDFTKRFNPVILKTEFNLICPQLGTAGTIDCVMELDGRRYIVDYKTSNNISDTFFIQLAAYKAMYELAFPEEQIDGVAVMWLSAKTRTEGKKGQYQGKGYQLLFPDKPIEHYFRLFQYTQALWNEVNGDLKPKNITYSLTHHK